jgi:hypothetical protein
VQLKAMVLVAQWHVAALAKAAERFAIVGSAVRLLRAALLHV